MDEQTILDIGERRSEKQAGSHAESHMIRESRQHSSNYIITAPMSSRSGRLIAENLNSRGDVTRCSKII
jgi:hypothetical protein